MVFFFVLDSSNDCNFSPIALFTKISSLGVKTQEAQVPSAIHVKQVLNQIQTGLSKSYLSAVGFSLSVPSISSVQLVVLKGDTLSFSVQLNEKAYSERLNLYHHSLIAWVILSKVEATWKLQDFKTPLTILWNLQN